MFDRTNMPTPFNQDFLSDSSEANRGEHEAREGKSAESALSRAVLSRYLAELFSEPDEAWLARVSGDETRCEVRRAAQSLGLPPDIANPPAIPDIEDILAERNSLFGHTVRSLCPPYELEYGRGEVFQQSQSLADLAGFYSAFGYQSSGPLAERPDHLIAELEFLSVLALKESLAIGSADADAAQCCRDAQRMFLRDHAATWMPAFCGRVRKAESAPFFLAVVSLCEALLVSWCDALHVSTGPTWMELRPVEEEDSTITCGADGDVQRVELGPTLAAALGPRS